jgi:integrase
VTSERRRTRGTGSIFPTPEGKFRAQLTLPDGRRQSQTHPTKAKAEAWLRRQAEMAARGELPADTKTTLAVFLARWLEDAVKPNRRHATYETYSILVATHISPALGHKRLAALTPLDVQRFYADKLATGLSRSTVQLLHAILRRALAQAVKWGLLPASPMARVEAPIGHPPAMQVWTPDQARRFLAAARADPLYPLWLVALTTGLRRGELLALRWQDVDLANARLQVRGGLHSAPGGWAIGPTKTGRSRVVALPAETVAVLRAHRDGADDAAFVFTLAGQPLAPTSVTWYFRRVADSAGLPRIRFHDLRHTCATLLLSRGVHPKVVQEMLGHASISMTLDTYSHVLPAMQDDAARALSAALFGEREKAPP